MPSSTEPPTNAALTTTNVLLGLLTAGIAIAFCYVAFFYKPELDPEQTARYAAEAQERFAVHSDDIQAEVVSLASDTLPPIGNAIYREVREDFGLYLNTLEEEGDVYLTNVERIFIEQVKAQYRDYLRQHRQVLAAEFPEHASEENVEQVLAEFERTFDKLIERYYLDEFRREAKRTAAVWEQFEPVEIPGPGEPSLDEQLADYTADWVVLAAAAGAEQIEAEPATPSAEPAPPASTPTTSSTPAPTVTR
ncbi:MAG: hypothetical protein WD872_16500 [Pirellulaceae bacterium]